MRFPSAARSLSRVAAPFLGEVSGGSHTVVRSIDEGRRFVTTVTSLLDFACAERFVHVQACCWRHAGALPVARPLQEQPCSCRHSRSFATAAAPAADVTLTDAAIQRLKHLVAEEAGTDKVALRLTVEAGGCSGFSYKFELESDQKAGGSDHVFDYDGAKLVIDDVSYEFLRGATVDFADELIKSTFEVVSNPNASGKCGCGSSFTPKGL